MTRLLVCLAVAVATLCSCRKATQMKPRSGGNPYEVVLLASDEGVKRTMDSILTADVTALPQGENMFDVSKPSQPQLTQATRYARCIVIAEKKTKDSIFSVRYERNTYAQPQLIVRIATPSAEELRKRGRKLTELLERFELAVCAESLRKSQNTKAARLVEQTFGWRMLVPEELSSTKRGADFLWFSDNGKLTMGNICVYSYRATTVDPKALIDKRDSIMARNIPGETPQMHMATERRCPLAVQRHKERMVCRGLWQMENDAMGGPFVCYAYVDSAQGKVVVAEAFVYAPGHKKRNRLKRLEGALSTLAKR